MTLDDYDAWLEKRGSSPNTRKQYRSRVRRIEGADDPVATALKILTDRRESAYAPKSKRMARAAYLSWARFTGNDALLLALSKEELKLPAPTRAKAQMPLPPAVYRAIRAELDAADYIKPAARACLGMMANRGLRRADALHLRRVDVSSALKLGTLSYVVKGGKRVEIGVLSSFRRYLELLLEQSGRWSQAHELISTSEAGAAMAIPAALAKVGEKVLETIDDAQGVQLEDIRGHVLRRTYAVAFFKAVKNDPTKLQAHMNWEKIETALSYVDFATRGELDAVAEQMMEDDDE